MTETKRISEELCEELFKKQAPGVKRAVAKVLLELGKAMQKHPEWPSDVVHAAAIVAEESGELVRAAIQCHYGEKDCDKRDLAKEASHTAATAIRFLVNPYRLPGDDHEEMIFTGEIG